MAAVCQRQRGRGREHLLAFNHRLRSEWQHLHLPRRIELYAYESPGRLVYEQAQRAARRLGRLARPAAGAARSASRLAQLAHQLAAEFQAAGTTVGGERHGIRLVGAEPEQGGRASSGQQEGHGGKQLVTPQFLFGTLE